MLENGKVAGPSGLVSRKVKLTVEAGVDMITGRINKISGEGVGKLSIFLNYHKEKGRS